VTGFEPRDPLSLTKPLLPAVQPPTTTQVGPYPPPTLPSTVQYASTPALMTSTTTVIQRSNAEIIVAWIFTVLTALYMLPWAVAATRRSTNSALIAVATFFLGWTGIGWLVLLVLSFLGPTVYSVSTHTVVAPVTLPPAPAGMWAYCAGDPANVRRWWDGHTWTGHTTYV
jgi:hypothetical protein